MTTASPAFRTVSRTVLVLDVLALIGCVVLAVVSATDTSSSTSAVGIAVALVLAIPVLVSLGLTAVGIRVRRSSAGGGMALVAIGAVIIAGLVTVVGLQLALGS